ncbi:glycoside hydrolase family 3 N-terminal domain-containing protein [Streptomyces sp. CC219B]|uniref:glycoside hydrolase family 3 N-terminal domain-containing protein n=1 Tax=Streptomyces sp. CC219B TaxID=3044574 RepID=UPI0032C00888
MPTPPAVNLWTVRDELAADRDGTLGRLAALGYGAVEPFEATDDPAGLRAVADDLGMTVCSTHSHRLLGREPEPVFEAALTLGTGLLIVPWGLPEAAFADHEALRRTADTLNSLAERAAAHGLRLGYHNYWWEFECRIDGRHALEALADLLVPGFFFEIDTYWAALGGADVPALLTRLGDRVPAVHLKDGPIAKGAPHTALGRGEMPTGGILAAAPGALRIVELQTCAGDVFDALAESAVYLGPDTAGPPHGGTGPGPLGDPADLGVPASARTVPGAPPAHTTAAQLQGRRTAVPEPLRDRAAQPLADQRWRDSSLPVADRVADLLGRMTVEEKVGQLGAYWVAPMRPGEPVLAVPEGATDPLPPQLGEAASVGLGQLTRVYGTEPVLPAQGLERLRLLQNTVIEANRFRIPALVHEECLTGLLSWTATVFPTPLAWGASFDPDLVEEMATAVGGVLRSIGAQVGLAPVLDVTRDYRFGRTEETIGDDPYLVGIIGSAYARGLESTGTVATLKHFAGYSAAAAGRNMAPVTCGPREFADVILEPFVAGVRLGGARSVMVAQNDVDGVPATADRRLLTDLLRDELGFTGVVQADYFGIWNLKHEHGVAAGRGDAAALALEAGVDMELPTIHCYGPPLIEKVREGLVAEELVDRAASRVLALKCELGMLDAAWKDEFDALPALEPGDLDPPEHRALARRLAEESVVLLANDGVLPLRERRTVALVGPLVEQPEALLGCYAFANHNSLDFLDEMSARAGLETGVRIQTLGDALAEELPDAKIQVTAAGVAGVHGDEDIAAAVSAARDADVCVLTLGDRAGLFGIDGRTSGEGCDAGTVALPGRQAALAKAVLDTGTPTVLLVISGRPYALGGLAERAAAVMQAFFPGEEGAGAVAGILSGRVEPSGRLPVSVPRHAGGHEGTYLHARTAGPTMVSALDPTPLYPFGHGLTWTTFGYSGLDLDSEVIPSDGTVRIGVTVRNDGERAGTEVVQLYLSDPVASTVRPVRRLAGWARVRLEPARSARVEFAVHADRVSFTGKDLRRVVEPGEIGVEVGRSCTDLPLRGSYRIEGPERVLGTDRVLTVPVTVRPL